MGLSSGYTNAGRCREIRVEPGTGDASRGIGYLAQAFLQWI